jgi:ankyrin repeat protein
VKFLLKGGADVHALNKWRETPLLTAANHGQVGAVEALLAADADPCKCTDTGWSPLSIAAYKGHDEVVRLLLEDGAPTEEDDPTLSALLQAATKGLPDTVELLLRHGADHTVTTKKGDTALSILVEQNLIDAAVEMVTEYNASIPRCSRDRKKVQRARLLINLRMKQLEREGKDDNDSTDDDEESDEDHSSNAIVAQHVDTGSLDGSAVAKSGKKNKKGKPKESAEEKARLAEEALLQELEKEDAEAKKEEAKAERRRRTSTARGARGDRARSHQKGKGRTSSPRERRARESGART